MIYTTKHSFTRQTFALDTESFRQEYRPERGTGMSWIHAVWFTKTLGKVSIHYGVLYRKFMPGTQPEDWREFASMLMSGRRNVQQLASWDGTGFFSMRPPDTDLLKESMVHTLKGFPDIGRPYSTWWTFM